jgi:dipeptidyl aminopeptidase/acylaminoacyl peptidase
MSPPVAFDVRCAARTVLVAALLVATAPRAGAQPPASSPPRAISSSPWTARALADLLTSVASVVGGDGPQWMPDGERILFPASLGAGSIWTVRADGQQLGRLTGDLSAQLPRLAPGGSHIAYLSEKSGNPELWLWDVAAGRDRQLTRFGARINAFAWSPDAREIAFAALRYGSFDIWVVSVADGAVRRVTSSDAYELSPEWTPDGRHLVYVRADDRWVDHDVMLVPATGGEGRVVATDRGWFDYGTIGTRSTFGAPLVSPDGRQLLFRSARSGWINYWIIPIAGGEPRPLSAEAADQSDARWSPDGRWVVFASNRNGAFDLRVVASGGGTARVLVPVTTGVAGSPAWSPDSRRVAFTLATPTRPQDLYVVALDGGAPRQLTFSQPEATERALVTPRKVHYTSDDFSIPAYLYLPPGARSGERFPGILYIHGGPTGQFSDSYQYQPQFLARMGYVVLAPNIRGSSGYGVAFEKANDPCWTICDLRDVAAGVAYLKTLPEVNGARMGITGISYGGIMSMAAVARAPDLFQAAIPQSGYADWVSFHDYNAELGHTKLLAHEWGPWPDSTSVYRRNSSIGLVHQVQAPVFLVHGVGREQAWRPGVAPIRASQEYALALEQHHKVLQYKTYPNETYYVNGRANQRQLLLDMLEWFDRYLKDAAAPVW